ncbi:MAG: terpene cyclase/mutase family protein [Planctomycetes bacterium]|nr:terpene cyclase/mutase family protein [Planctomycetota bacterium]
MLLMPTIAGDPPSAEPPVAEIRRSVERSLPYIEKEGVAWINERNCISCHVVSFLLWSHNEAKASGVKLDAKKLDEWTTWSFDYSLNARQWYKLTDATQKQLRADAVDEATLAKLKPLLNKGFPTDHDFVQEVGRVLKGDEFDKNKNVLVKRALQPRQGEKNDGGSMSALGQLLVGRVGSKNPRLEPFLEAAPAVMRNWQEANGAFRAAGQLPKQNRPAAEGDEITTGWAVLGFASLNRVDAETKKSIDAGLAFYKKGKPGKSHEKLLVDLLIEDKFGNADGSARLIGEVIKRQNADGGWAWIPESASDAFATGQTLYALGAISAKVDRAAIGKAQRYLLATQNKDGYWAVSPKAVTDPKSNDARLRKLNPIYHFWGTAWAAIGLSRSVR